MPRIKLILKSGKTPLFDVCRNCIGFFEEGEALSGHAANMLMDNADIFSWEIIGAVVGSAAIEHPPFYECFDCEACGFKLTAEDN